MSRADSVLLREDLDVIVDGIRHARWTRRVIAEDLAWATVYNVVAVPLAALGLIPPYWAAAGMPVSSLVVVANALRLSSVGERSRTSRSLIPIFGLPGTRRLGLTCRLIVETAEQRIRQQRPLARR